MEKYDTTTQNGITQTISMAAKSPLDFISPIKILIKKKTVDDIRLVGTFSEYDQNDSEPKSSKPNPILRFAKHKNYHRNKTAVLNDKSSTKSKKVSFRSHLKNKQPMAEVYLVKSYKKENQENTFKGLRNKNEDEEDDGRERKRGHSFCKCTIF